MAPLIAITALFNPPDYGKEFAQLQEKIITVEQRLASQGEEFIAGLAITKGVAEFQDSLAAPMTASSTTFTLVRGTNNNTGTSLSGAYIMKIDSEFIEASCTATACTVTTRGLSDEDLETHVYLLTKSHARGAAVKITDAYVVRIQRILNGDETLENKISYTSHPTFTSGSNQLVDAKYVDDTNNQGAASGNSSQIGIFKSATVSQLGSGYSDTSTTTEYVATSSNFNVAYSANTQRVPVTQTNGLLSGDWIPTASSFTFTGGNTFSTATTTFSVTSVFTGSIYASGDAGTAGQLLVSGGNGKASDWKTVTGAVTLVANSALYTPTTTVKNIVGATTAFIGKVVIPTGIRVDKIFLSATRQDVDGTIKVGLYSEDGLTQLSSGTTSSTGAAGAKNLTVTTTMTTVVLPAGSYYLAIVPVSTVDVTLNVWNTNVVGFTDFNSGTFGTLNSLPLFEGTQVVSAGTLPTTITPKTMTSSNLTTPVFVVTSL